MIERTIQSKTESKINSLDLRPDKGALWENLLISERMKKLEYANDLANQYFWRTSQQQEIDYVEEKAGEITGFKFKWNPNAKVKIPLLFQETYKAEVGVITQKNFRSFLIE